MEEHLEFQNELSKLLSSGSKILKSIHIDDSFSSDSEPDGRPLDEDYMKNQPPPCDYNIIKDHVVKIGTECTTTKKKQKKKKIKTNEESSSVSEHATTKLFPESDVSLLSQASNLSKSDINPFNVLVTISDDSPLDIVNLCVLDGDDTDTQPVGNMSSKKDSSKFEFDVVSDVDSSWETVINKKIKKLKKNQIKENAQKSSSLGLKKIESNTTSDFNRDSLASICSNNANNDTNFFLPPVSLPISTDKENFGRKKKTKKNKKALKKTSEFSNSTQLCNIIPAAEAAYINNNVLVSTPSTCYQTSSSQSRGIIGSGSVVREVNDHQISNRVDDLFENTYTPTGIENRLEIFMDRKTNAEKNYLRKQAECGYFNTQNTSEIFYNAFPQEVTRCTKGEPVNCLYNKPNHDISCMNPLSIENNKELSQKNDESVCIKSKYAKLKNFDDGLSQAMDNIHRKNELIVVTHDKPNDISCVPPLFSGMNGMLFQSNGQCQPREEKFRNKITLLANHIDAQDSISQMQEQRMTSGTKKKKIQIKQPQKEFFAGDRGIQSIYIEESLSQLGSRIESESIIWDWELYDNRQTHDQATLNEIDLFGSGQSIHSSDLSVAEDATQIGKISKNREVGHIKSNLQYPIKGSYFFEFGARLEKDQAGNFIYMSTPNENIDTCQLDNCAKSCALSIQMQAGKHKSSTKKCKKECQKQHKDNYKSSDCTWLSIPAANAESEKPVPYSNVPISSSSKGYVGLHSSSSTYNKKLSQSESTIGSEGVSKGVDTKSHVHQTLNKVDDLFKHVIPSNTYTHGGTDNTNIVVKDVNGHALGIQEQPQQTQTSTKKRKKRKKKCQKGSLISECDIQDTCIYDESDFSPLLVSMKSTKKSFSSMNSNNVINYSEQNIKPSTQNIAPMSWQISGGDTEPQLQSKLVHSAALPEPAPSNLFLGNKVSAKNKQKKQNIRGSDITRSKIYEDEDSFNPLINESMSKDDMEKLENDINRFFQSNTPYEFTASIFAASHDVFCIDSTDKYITSFVDKKVSKRYEQISYTGTSVGKPAPDSNASRKIINNSSQQPVLSKKCSAIPIKSECAQDILLKAIATPATIVNSSKEHGMNRKLSYISNILASHIELIKCHENISHISIMIPGHSFQHIHKDQKCQNLILDFLIAGGGLQDRTSLFFYNEIHEKFATCNDSIKETVYLEKTSQKNLHHRVSNPINMTDAYENAEIISHTPKIYHSFDDVAITATTTGIIQNLNVSSMRVECKNLLSSEINDGIMKNVMIGTNTCFEEILNNGQYSANSSSSCYLKNDISNPPINIVPALVDDCMTDICRKLEYISNILALHTEIIKFHENISNISIMIPANLLEHVQKDQKCQNLILEFITSGGAFQERTSLIFYDKTNEKSAIGDDSITDILYQRGPLQKNDYKVEDVNIPRASNSVEVTDTDNTGIESRTKLISSSLGSVSVTATGNLQNINVSSTKVMFEKIVSKENNGVMKNALIDTNTCFDVMPNSDSGQTSLNSLCSCSLKKCVSICDNSNSYASTTDCNDIQNSPYSSIVRNKSSYTSSSIIIVENLLRLAVYCLFQLVQEVISR